MKFEVNTFWVPISLRERYKWCTSKRKIIYLKYVKNITVVHSVYANKISYHMVYATIYNNKVP